MTKTWKVLGLLMAFALIVAACSGTSTETTTAATEPPATEAPATTAPMATEAPTETTMAEPMGAVCDEPVVVGVITDLSGPLAIYGAHMNRGVPIGFAYAT